MLNSTRMQQVTIFVLKQDVHDLIQTVIETELFQPLEVPSLPLLEDQLTCFQQSGLVKAYLGLEQDLGSLLQRFGLSPPELTLGNADPENDLKATQLMVEEVTKELEKLDRQRDELQVQFQSVKREQVVRKALAEIPLSEEQLSAPERMILRLGWTPLEALSQIRERVKSFTSFLTPIAIWEHRVLLLAVTLPHEREQVTGILSGLGFQSHDVCKFSFTPASKEHTLEVLRFKIKAVESAIGSIRSTWSQRLLQAMNQVRKNLFLLTSEQFGRLLGPTVVFQGWVPEPDVPRFKEYLVAGTHGRVWVKSEAIEGVATGEGPVFSAPILHRNPILLQPFQRLVSAYGEPAYAEVDPTPFFAVSFMVMFGMMFGDIGHGAVLMALGYGVFHRLRRWRDVGILLMECGTASIVFGILYGTIFGFEELVFPAIWLKPMDNIPRLLSITLLLGILLISIGLCINMANAIRRGAFAEAVFGRQGLTVALFYWLLAGVGVRFLLAEGPVVIDGVWVLVPLLGLVILLFLHQPVIRWVKGDQPVLPRPILQNLLESAIEVIDTLTRFASNTISFLRIAAFALLHAALFVAIFSVADMLKEGPGGDAFYWFTLVLGNILVIVVEGVIVTIQILRLEYYEFFSKFYAGTGREFRPLRVIAGQGR